MPRLRKLPAAALPLLLSALLTPVLPRALAAQSPIPSPTAHLGFAVGADRQLARWEQIVDYIQVVAAASDRVQAEVVGETTSGNPFLVVVISSPENLRRIDHYRELSRRIASGRVTRAEAAALAAEGKVVVFVNHNIHSTEIGSSQTSLELIYELAVGDSAAIHEILDNTILVHVPSGNPDGQIMTVDWYRQNVGTDFEQSPMPWLYHPYVGHDNNRDFFMGNMIETRLMLQLLYRDWPAQIYLDQHQMGATGPRMFVPPHPDPPNERVHPLVWQQIKFLGGGMATDLQAAGRLGVVNSAMYRIYHQGGALSVWWRNILGLLTESASASMATPVTITPEQLQPARTDAPFMPEIRPTQNMPAPWPGGEWRLRDIIDQQMIAAMSVLRQAARYRREFLYNQYQMAADAIAKGESEAPFAYIVPAGQADPNTAAEMIDRLLLQGIEVHRARADFTAAGTTYPAGSYVLLAAQAVRPALVDLFERQGYPELRVYQGGPPIRPYDVTGYTLPLQMGVRSVAVAEPFDTSPLERISAAARVTVAAPGRASRAYVLDHQLNDAVIAVNRLLRDGVPVYRTPRAVELDGRSLPPGAFVIPADASDAHARMQRIAAEIAVPVVADPAGLDRADWGAPLVKPRIALYKSWVPSMDEGWTRWILERFDFEFESVHDDVVRAGSLRDRFDVFVVPAELSLQALLEGHAAGRVPPEYAGGIGEVGLENLIRFVRAGGTLLTLDSGGEVVLQRFDVPVRNAIAGLSDEEFFGPGSIVTVEIAADHPLGFGLEPTVSAKFVRSPAYEIVADAGDAQRVRVIASYPRSGSLLRSGLLLGEEHLHGRAAAVEIPYGDGNIIMLGFRTQHRAQTHATYKLLFNALLRGARRTAADVQP